MRLLTMKKRVIYSCLYYNYRKALYSTPVNKERRPRSRRNVLKKKRVLKREVFVMAILLGTGVEAGLAGAGAARLMGAHP